MRKEHTNENDNEEHDVLLLLYEHKLLQDGFIQVGMRCGNVLLLLVLCADQNEMTVGSRKKSGSCFFVNNIES